MLAGELDFTPRRFSTAAIQERARVAYWRETFGRQTARCDIESTSNDPLKAEAVTRALPGLRSTSFVSTPAHLERTMQMVADGDDALGLLVSRRGSVAASQRGHDVSLRPGDATLLLHAEPCAVTHAHIRFQALIVPRAPIAALVTNVEDAAMRAVPGSNAALRLLMSYVRAISGGLTAGQPELRDLVAAHVHDLVAIAIGATRDGTAIAEERGLAAARLAAVKTDVIENLGFAELTLPAIAARHGLTPRTVQRLFEREGTSFSAFRLEQQLARSRSMLRDKRYASLTIATIAFASGFGDLSYFHRAFRRRFGATPSEMRFDPT